MKRLLLSFIFVFLGLGLAFSQISPELSQKMEENPDQYFSVIVSFKEHFDVSQIAASYNLRGDEVSVKAQTIAIMKDKAERAHSFLKNNSARSNQIREFKSFWIANMVGMQATPAVIREIALQPEVEEIILDEEQVFIDYLPGVPQRDAWGLDKIKSKQVNQTYKGKGVLVAVIDTGVNYDHVDLKGRVLKGKDCINNDMDPLDDNGHGSHCAGTVAGTTYGVAPEATILAVKVLSGAGSGTWQNVADGVQYVADYNVNGKQVDVASMSLGGRAPIQAVLRTAFDNAVKMGIHFAIAAGNSGPSARTIGTPGDQKDVISVGATDINDAIASFSSRGPVVAYGAEYIKPDISAPGVNITSCWKGTSTASNTISGTSMATPHVAGLMALVLNAKPGTNQQGMKDILTKTSLDLGTPGLDTSFGYGRIQADKATAAAQLLAEERLDIEQEVAFQIGENGTILKNITKENPLWEMNIKVWVTVLNPAGNYSGTFSIIKAGKPTQSGQINNLPSGQTYYVGTFRVYDGENTLNLKAQYTGSSTDVEGLIRVKVQAQ